MWGLSPSLHHAAVPALVTQIVGFLINAMYWHVLALVRLLVDIDSYWGRACELQMQLHNWYLVPISISLVFVALRQRRARLMSRRELT